MKCPKCDSSEVNTFISPALDRAVMCCRKCFGISTINDPDVSSDTVLAKRMSFPPNDPALADIPAVRTPPHVYEPLNMEWVHRYVEFPFRVFYTGDEQFQLDMNRMDSILSGLKEQLAKLSK